VSRADPTTPSGVVAVIVADPFATAVAKPAASTVTTDESDPRQMNAVPEIGLPLDPRATALSRTLSPTAVSVSNSRMSSTVAIASGTSTSSATGTLTVSSAELETPPVVAVIVVVPAAAVTTLPMLSTVATPESEDLQLKIKSEIVLSEVSRAIASNCTITPRAVTVSAAGLISTAASATVSGSPDASQ
jgi:hypothetical protein